MNTDPHNQEALGLQIKTMAIDLGFDACGFAKAEPVDAVNAERLTSWLAHDHHDGMEYMANHSELRIDPCKLVPGAKTVICLAINYHQKNFQPDNAHYKVSQYAAGLDYHGVIKQKLYALLQKIQTLYPRELNARVFTDSAPVLERYWARKAGLGAFGKNTCLILPRKGSYYFLAEIIMDQKLPYDEPYTMDLCGKCTRCMDSCPTHAIIAPGVVHAPRCISCLTIEQKENIPEEIAPHLSDFIFGCDICQEVCPHNQRFATPTAVKDFSPIAAVSQWNRGDWNNLDKPTYRRSFIKTRSPIARASFEKLKANIRAVAENT